MGVTLYAFVYGKLPFHDDNIVVLYDKIRSNPLSFPPVPFASDDLKDLISLMLEKDPSKRITLPDIKVSWFVWEDFYSKVQYGAHSEVTFYLSYL